MTKKTVNQSFIVYTSMAVIGLTLLLLHLFFHKNMIPALIVWSLMLILYSFYVYGVSAIQKSNNDLIEESLDHNFKEALDYTKVGVLVYNDDFEVVWQSQFFKDNNMEHLNQSILQWIPQLSEVIEGDVDSITVVIEGKKYEVVKKDEGKVLMFKDITELYDITRKYENSALVVGVANLDNYEEILEYDDENISATYKLNQMLFDYLKNYGIIFKQIKSNRLYLVLNEEILDKLMKDHFSICANIRKEARSLDLPITLSLSFSRGGSSQLELDELSGELIDLAISRGGDQIAIQKIGEEVHFYGGSSEAYEKQSKTKVRAIAGALRDLIMEASNVLIVGHENMDADAVASSLMISVIARKYVNDVAIVNRNMSIEPMIASVLERYKEQLSDHEFITLQEAENRLGPDTLVVMVDHHNPLNTAARPIIENANKVAIIDHHRRSANLGSKTVLVYIEPSASSASEMILEIMQFFGSKVSLSRYEANIAYLGILIDTNRFRQRVGARTFDVLGILKRYGCDTVECDELNVYAIDEIRQKSALIENAIVYEPDIIIATGADDDIYSRSVISKAADELVYTKGIKVAFVIAKIGEDEISVSARSIRDVNVQRIMEQMHGGGHMTSAGLQRKNTTIQAIVNELLDVLEEYYRESADESNIA